MSAKRILLVAIGLCGAAFGIVQLVRYMHETPLVVRGAVVTQDPDPTRQLPISDAEVALQIPGDGGTVKSDTTGFFRILLPRQVRPGERISLRIRHPDYQPAEWQTTVRDELYIARLVPLAQPSEPDTHKPETTISNVVVRYSINTKTAANVGSAVKTFEIVNTGNIPCDGRTPCSPDGKWKASIGTATMDAGSGNEFHNARASCIAGPCPFTRIEENNFARDSQTLHISVLNWSDTATFLVEAEVFHPTVSSFIRQSYPVIFERALTFTLPAAAEGVSIDAQVNGEMIVFPLGPALILSWANCQMTVNKDGSTVYRCELKPGYRFP